MCLLAEPVGMTTRVNTDMCEGFEYADSHESGVSLKRDQSEPSVAEEENLLPDNVQSFINMGILQTKYLLADEKKFTLPRTRGKKLLLLDMDETMLHAATLSDIYVEQMYGKDAAPSFITSFEDIDIGVFLRPYLFDMLGKISPYFEICVFTASEEVYADAILN